MSLDRRALPPRLHSTATNGATGESGRGTDAHGIPHYIIRTYSPAERALLRSAFGVDEPGRLYLSDSSALAILKYDSRRKKCAACRVNSYRVGFLSLRHPGETWIQFENRLRRMRSRDFPAAAHRVDISLGDLDPRAKRAFDSLLAGGRRAGFNLTVRETYRTPWREALLLHDGRGQTFTATSMHSYGRAVDIAVDDGNPAHAATRADWIRFRKFVVGNPVGPFQLIGSTTHTWDWPHVEMPAADIGFHSIAQALASAARCTSVTARAGAPSPARLGGAAADPCVFIPFLPASIAAR